MNKPRIGLTGAKGVLGRSIQEYWRNVDWVPFTGDIRFFTDVSKWICDSQPLDGLIHLAAMVPTKKVEENPFEAFQTNVVGTCHILEAVKNTNLNNNSCWIFLASSSHVYGSSEQPLSEDAILKPMSIYGETKRQAEEWANIYLKNSGLNICIGRIFSYSSKLQAKEYLIPSLIEKINNAAKNSVLEIYGLHGTRDFISTGEICRVIRHFFEKRITGTINIGSGEPVKLFDIAYEIRNRLSRNDVIIQSPYKDSNHICADLKMLSQNGINISSNIYSIINELIK